MPMNSRHGNLCDVDLNMAVSKSRAFLYELNTNFYIHLKSILEFPGSTLPDLLRQCGLRLSTGIVLESRQPNNQELVQKLSIGRCDS